MSALAEADAAFDGRAAATGVETGGGPGAAAGVAGTGVAGAGSAVDVSLGFAMGGDDGGVETGGGAETAGGDAIGGALSTFGAVKAG